MRSTRLRVGMVVVVGSLTFASALQVACGSFSSSGDDTGTDAPTGGDVSTPDVVQTIDASTDAGAPCAIGTCRIVFVTSASFEGDFGGIGQGDTECNKLAQASTHPAVEGRTFKAWLSAPDAGANQRHTKDDKPYVRVDGVTVANGWIELTNTFGDAGVLRAPIQVDEKGTSAGTAVVWTGTTHDGSPSGNTCGGWTLPAGAGQVGRADRVDEAWTDTDVPLGFSGTCSNPGRLYCFEE